MTPSGRERLNEDVKWRSRKVTYWTGTWSDLAGLIPDFEIREFRTEKGQSNPFLRTVVRHAVDLFDGEVPIGVVSPTYTLVPHKDIAEACLGGIRDVGIDPSGLRCDLGLSEFGEWMNFRVYLPGHLAHTPADGEPLHLRLECFNSVEGSSRLVLFLGWLRWVCANGMVAGTTKVELREAHSRYLDIGGIPGLIQAGIAEAQQERARLRTWDSTVLDSEELIYWIDEDVAQAWGKKAACRTLHICRSAWDVEPSDPFVGGEPSEKAVYRVRRVPGAPAPARNLYDASQALAWIATNRANAEERVLWQTQVPGLVDTLASNTGFEVDR